MHRELHLDPEWAEGQHCQVERCATRAAFFRSFLAFRNAERVTIVRVGELERSSVAILLISGPGLGLYAFESLLTSSKHFWNRSSQSHPVNTKGSLDDLSLIWKISLTRVEAASWLLYNVFPLSRSRLR